MKGRTKAVCIVAMGFVLGEITGRLYDWTAYMVIILFIVPFMYLIGRWFPEE